jgi:hypothetical protein
MNSAWRSVTACLLLFALAAGPRVAYILVKRTYRSNDGGAEMERVARSLAARGEMADAYGPASGTTAHLAPLYPLYLGGLYRLLGPDADVTRLVQQLSAVLAVALSLALLPLVARRTGLSAGAGWAAAVLMALSPLNMFQETSGAWEHAHAAPLMVGILLAFAGLRAAGWNGGVRLAVAAVLTAVAALFSPPILLAAILMMLVEVCSQKERRGRVLAGVAVILGVTGLALAPWIYRNHQALGGFVPLRSNFGLELWIGNNDTANGKSFVTYCGDPASPHRVQHPFCNPVERAHCQEVGELAYMREKQNLGLHWIAGHPGRFVLLTVQRFRYFWFPAADLWEPDDPRGFWKALAFGVAGGGCLLGLAWLFRARETYRWLLLAAVVGPSLPYMIVHVEARYRYPTQCLTVLLACDVVFRLAVSLRSWLRRSRLPVALVDHLVRHPEPKGDPSCV